MANSWRWQVGVAMGLGLLASTAACERKDAPPATIGQPAQLAAAPPTSFVTVTSTPATIPVALVDDCVEFVQFAAFVGVADMATMWEAANHDVARLRENCLSLGRADLDALREFSQRRDELEAFFGVTTTTSPSASVTTS